jgi:hypothetical protein
MEEGVDCFLALMEDADMRFNTTGRGRDEMKAYQVLDASGALIWETNNLPAAYRRADRIGGTVAFNYEVNA